MQEIIEKQGQVIGEIKGNSMLPLFDKDKDLVKIGKITKELKVDDIVLFKKQDKYVLHRILNIKGNTYLTSGDNTKTYERVNRQDIIGVVISYYKDGREIKLTDAEYQSYLKNLNRNVETREIIYKYPSIDQNHLNLIELIRAVELNKEPKLENVDYQKLFNLAYKQRVSAFVFKKINQKECPQKIYNLFLEDYNLTLQRSVLFEHEKEIILKKFRKNGIKYLPLKGNEISKYYPKGSLRYSSDIDIYIDNPTLAREIMKSLGYVYKKTENVDVYKKDFFNIELHKVLFSDYEKVLSSYYEKPFDLAYKQKEYAYSFNDENFYLYFIAHYHKHYAGPGAGIRFNIDLYYLLKNLKLDETVINLLLMKLNLKEFNDEQVSFTKNLFDNNKELDVDKINLLFMGTVYGSVKNIVSRGIEEKGRLRYLIDRFIPSYNFMIHSEPWLKKVPFLYPLSIIVRIIRTVLDKNRLVDFMKELAIFKKMKK